MTASRITPDPSRVHGHQPASRRQKKPVPAKNSDGAAAQRDGAEPADPVLDLAEVAGGHLDAEGGDDDADQDREVQVGVGVGRDRGALAPCVFARRCSDAGSIRSKYAHQRQKASSTVKAIAPTRAGLTSACTAPTPSATTDSPSPRMMISAYRSTQYDAECTCQWLVPVRSPDDVR